MNRSQTLQRLTRSPILPIGSDRMSAGRSTHVAARAAVLACLAVAACASAPPSAASRNLVVRRVSFLRRVALVIGNGGYRSQPALDNALNDAREVGARLRALGFVVESFEDTTHPRLAAAVEAFTRTMREGDLAVIYYAGHGVSFRGASFLLPVEYQVSTGALLERDAYPVSRMINAVARTQATTVLMFDACRGSPFVRAPQTRSTTARVGWEGFGGHLEAPEHTNMVVINATRDGALALDQSRRCPGHSPFACALIRRIPEPRPLTELSTSIISDVDEDTGGYQRPLFSFGSSVPIVFDPSARPTDRALPPRGEELRTVAGVLAGVGGAGLIAGTIGLTLRADAEDGLATRCNAQRVCPPTQEVNDLTARYETATTMVNVGLIAGGALAGLGIAGLVWRALRVPEGSSRPNVSIRFEPHGLGMEVGGAF